MKSIQIKPKPKPNLLLSRILESNSNHQQSPSPSQLPKSIYITIQDSISQSALPIIHQIIKSHSQQQSNHHNKLLIIGLNYHPSIYQPRNSNSNDHHQKNRIQSIDLSSIDYQEIHVNRLIELVETELNPIQPESSITIIIDSLGECIKKWSHKETLRLFNQLLQKYQSKLIVIDSPHLSLAPQQPTNLSPTMNFSTTFTSSTFVSHSSIHLKLYPTSLYHHLIHHYQIPCPNPIPKTPTQPTGTSYDPRLFPLLEELHQSTHPFCFNSSLIPQALLIPPSSSDNNTHSQPTGSCLIRWISKNLGSLSLDSMALNLNLPSTHSKKNPSVLHGLEALKLDMNHPEEVPSLIAVPIEDIIVKPNRPTFNKPSQPKDPMNDLQDQVTFNLSLTEQQRTDRDSVQLPFLPRRDQHGIVIEAPGDIYDGSFQNKPNPNQPNGLIVYEPDSADDMDDEEPDDEL